MSDKTLVFEVTLVVEAAVVSGFEIYMIEKHIPEVLATGCFSDAMLVRDGREYRVVYTTDQERFDRYLAEHAPTLRTDFVHHFPSGIQITRRSWDMIRRFEA